MGILHAAVNQEKGLLIRALMEKGVYKANEKELYQKSITELINDYEHATAQIYSIKKENI